jgi:NAD(P)H-dependent FMN reductase
MSLKLNVIIGSTRPGRAGPVIGQWLKQAATEHGKFDVELVDLADFGLPLLDEAAHPMAQQYANEPTKRWSASVASADAFVFLTPEYDYFPPASLVNAVQVLLKEWSYKPAGVMSYAGVSGGLRAAQVLRPHPAGARAHVRAVHRRRRRVPSQRADGGGGQEDARRASQGRHGHEEPPSGSSAGERRAEPGRLTRQHPARRRRTLPAFPLPLSRRNWHAPPGG